MSAESVVSKNKVFPVEKVLTELVCICKVAVLVLTKADTLIVLNAVIGIIELSKPFVVKDPLKDPKVKV